MSPDRITPARVTSLLPNEVFVFGSNTSGVHGAGAALLAYKCFGAVLGVGRGGAGQTYAIPTKEFLRGRLRTIPAHHIASSVLAFTLYAEANPNLRFLVTEIGCGLAGHSPADIAPLFLRASKLSNVCLPERFWTVLSEFRTPKAA